MLHWWHPPLEAGIRTRFADDLLWLPFIACEYARQTGDHGVLDERGSLPDRARAAGRRGRDLPPGRRQRPERQRLRALLPRAGPFADRRRARPAAVRHRRLERRHEPRRSRGPGRERVDGLLPGEHHRRLRALSASGAANPSAPTATARTASAWPRALNEAGWDGDWYRRGYYDDGAPLGSHLNRECRIDALAQAWSVLSGWRRQSAPRRRWTRSKHSSSATTSAWCAC